VPTNYTDLRDRFGALLADFEPVVGAAVIGSRARDGADASADLDVVVFTPQTEELLADSGWLSPLGRIWAAAVDRSAPSLPVKRLLLDDAAQLDLLVLPPDAVEQSPPGAEAVLADIARRGFAALKEGGPVPDGLGELAERARAAQRARPSQEQFSQLVAGFWIDCVRAARRLGRQEVWSARRIIDGPMKSALVELQAWTVRAFRGGDADTFWQGRRLERWAGGRFLTALAGTFGDLDAASARHDLMLTMDQFRLLAIEAASRWSLDYAEGLDRRVTVWVRTWD
jgi:predicted nucleotidyltransferase